MARLTHRLRGPVVLGALLALALPACKSTSNEPAGPTTDPAAAAAPPAQDAGGIVRVLCGADPVEGAAPLTVTFVPDVAPQGDSGLTYAWDFGDGTTSTQARPQHVYATGGTRTVQLTARRAGTTGTCTTTVYVYGNLTASCRSEATGGNGAHFRVIPSFCIGDECSYSWDFGGAGAGTRVTEARPDFTYSAPGTYTATATVRTGGQTATCRTTVTVP
jgi:hypothetical protein